MQCRLSNRFSFERKKKGIEPDGPQGRCKNNLDVWVFFVYLIKIKNHSDQCPAAFFLDPRPFLLFASRVVAVCQAFRFQFLQERVNVSAFSTLLHVWNVCSYVGDNRDGEISAVVLTFTGRRQYSHACDKKISTLLFGAGDRKGWKRRFWKSRLCDTAGEAKNTNFRQNLEVVRAVCA